MSAEFDVVSCSYVQFVVIPIQMSTFSVFHVFVLFEAEPISYPEPSTFLLRMLHENEGLWKGPVLRRS